jgi:hypothetical protein
MSGLFRFLEAKRPDPAVEAWLERQPLELGAIARTWFGRMRACGPDVREVMHDGCPTACVEDAAFAYVGVYRDHANVGFFQGAVLEDPARLLEGTGKRMRHVKLKSGAPIAGEALEALICFAYADMKARLTGRAGDER